MSKIKLLLIALTVALYSCGGSDGPTYPLDKRYWDLNDYENVILDLKYSYEADEQKPTLDNPETRAIVEKLVDQQNFKVVLEDQELGLNYRNDIAQKFFDTWRNMNTIYNATDRQDKYLYEKEMLAVWHFGLALQLDYFSLGTQQNLEGADSPDDFQTRNVINDNVRRLIGNYMIYLDEVDNEDAYSEQGLKLFAEGLDTYFPKLVETYPDANYAALKKKAEALVNKSESEVVKKSLNDLVTLLTPEPEDQLAE